MALKCPNCGYDNEDEALCCNLCQIVLQKEKPKPAARDLPYAGWAEDLVRRSGQDLLIAGLGIELDYSPASVAGVDAAFAAMWGNEGDSPDKDEYVPSQGKQGVILAYGSYFGEVLRRVLDGVWDQDPRFPKLPVHAWIAWPGGRVLPINKVLKRFKNGHEDRLFPLMIALTEGNPAVRKTWAPGFLKHAALIVERGAMPLEQRLPVAQEYCAIAAALDPALAGEAAALKKKLSAVPLEAAPFPRREAAPPPPGTAEESLSMARKLFEEEPAQARALMAQAEALLNAKKPAEALPLIEQALALTPEDFRAWRSKCIALCFLGRFEEAAASVACATDLAPSDVEGWKMRALVLMKLARRVEAADCWKTITGLAPVPEHWRERGWVCNLAERYDESLECLTRALESKPGDPEILLEKVAVLDRSGQTPAAMLLAATTLAVAENLAKLKAIGLQKLRYLISAKMSPELNKLLADRIGT